MAGRQVSINLRREHKRKADRRIATLVAQELTAVLPNIINMLKPTDSVDSATPPLVPTPTLPPRCTFKHFNSCNPVKFTGTEGATGLLQWFESMENTFVHSECPADLRILYGTSVFQNATLTWWNNEKRSRGFEAALALSWEEFKEIMIAKFCPRTELVKLERVLGS